MRTQVLVLTNKDRKWFPSGPTRSRWGQKRRPWGKPGRSLEQTFTTRDGPLVRLLEVRTVPQALRGVTTIAPASINTFPPDHFIHTHQMWRSIKFLERKIPFILRRTLLQRTIPHICHFFTRAKLLENKIYTEKRQFFALNL